jgi:hypothetical protein
MSAPVSGTFDEFVESVAAQTMERVRAAFAQSGSVAAFGIVCAEHDESGRPVALHAADVRIDEIVRSGQPLEVALNGIAEVVAACRARAAIACFSGREDGVQHAIVMLETVDGQTMWTATVDPSKPLSEAMAPWTKRETFPALPSLLRKRHTRLN